MIKSYCGRVSGTSRARFSGSAIFSWYCLISPESVCRPPKCFLASDDGYPDSEIKNYSWHFDIKTAGHDKEHKTKRLHSTVHVHNNTHPRVAIVEDIWGPVITWSADLYFEYVYVSSYCLCLQMLPQRDQSLLWVLSFIFIKLSSYRRAVGEAWRRAGWWGGAHPVPGRQLPSHAASCPPHRWDDNHRVGTPRARSASARLRGISHWGWGVSWLSVKRLATARLEAARSRRILPAVQSADQHEPSVVYSSR